MTGNQHQLSDIDRGLVCQYCGNKTELIDSGEIYRKSWGFLWICRPCDAYVGCHGDSDIAKGSVADKALRDARQAAHKAFDPLWHAKMRQTGCDKRAARDKAYQWLARCMDIPREKAHIAMLSLEQCQQVVELCEPYLKKKK